MDVKDLMDYAGIYRDQSISLLPSEVELLQELIPRFNERVRCGFELEGDWTYHEYVRVGGREAIIEEVDELHSFIMEAAEEQGGLYGTLLDAYDDGSVNTELVTQPLRVDEIVPVLDLWLDVLDTCGVIFDSRVGAGCHMTVSVGTSLPLIVKANVEQLMRYFTRPLLEFGCNHAWSRRDREYYSFNKSPIIRLKKGERLNGENKYKAVHFKKFGDVTAFEFRYPDPAPTRKLYSIAILNMAIVLKAIKISFKYNGVFEIKNSRIQTSRRAYLWDGCDSELIDELIDFMADDIKSVSGLTLKEWMWYIEN